MLGEISILDNVQALIQSQIGSFLKLKSSLNEMSGSPVLTISDRASQLLSTQLSLEEQLPSAIEKSQAGNFSDLISASGFFVLMEKHIYDVKTLVEDYTSLGDSAKPTIVSGIPDLLLYAIGGAAVLYFVVKRKK
jgi:hypothetical protein